MEALKTVASFCRNVVVKIAFAPRHSLSSTPRQTLLETASNGNSEMISDMIDSYCPYVEPPVAWKFVVQRKPNEIDRELLDQWCETLKLFPNMSTFHIACNGDPAWSGCTDIESLLIMLRIALERTNPEHLHTVRLSPMHAMGIMHLRWAGTGAYGEACASRNSVWQRLKVLDMGIRSPYMHGRLSTAQKQLFDKILADYLQSFSQTLTILKLSWLGANGPDLFYDGGEACDDMTTSWKNLEQLWFGNVTLRRQGILAAKQLAPKLQKFMVSSHVLDEDGTEHVEDGHEGWVDCLVHGGYNKDTNSWMTLRDVRISAIPDPLFRSRLA
jgi:hypothetical protein